MNVKTFRDLVAWQLAMTLSKSIYRATREMPADERFGLTLQMRRSSVSVPSNIAEGFGRQSRAELLKFLRTARGSLNELSTQYQLAFEMEMLKPNSKLLDQIAETDRVLQGLIRSLERKKD